MAGRPATAYSGQPTLLYWVIVFAVLTVASLGLFIFQLTNVKGAENRAQGAEQKMRQYGTPPQYYADEARARNTNAFAAMADDGKKIALAVTGAAEDVGPTILTKVAAALKDVSEQKPGVLNPTDSLLDAFRKLDEQQTQDSQTAQELADQVASLQRDKGALTAQLETTRKQFEEQVRQLSGQLAAAEEQKNAILQQKDEQLRDTQNDVNAQKQQVVQLERDLTTQARDKDIEIGRLQTQISLLQKQIQELKPSSFDPNAILTKADGRILRAVPGSDVVYINLGQVDKVKVGMGFEVFAQLREPGAGLRGKASIEVVTVMDETSECRVLRRTPNQPIIAGDNIVNIAYERGFKPKFVVRGDFDLNHDGVIDYDGLEQITNLIRQWGGQVVDSLDETVNFVVIGLAPGAASVPAGEPVTDVVRAQMQQKDLALSKFRSLIDQAQKMYIPVITQDQFLFLLGTTSQESAIH